jgi:transcriptional regulator with XRE-family HTH domain
MAGSSARSPRKKTTEQARAQLWKRVGTFVRDRREALGLSQGDIIRVLGYKSRNAVSNIEVGIEGLPAKRAYAWADLLEVPRDAFFQFVTGQTERLEFREEMTTDGGRLSAVERELLESYRKLPPKYRRRLREQARELEMLASAAEQ